MADPRGERGWGPKLPPPSFWIFFFFFLQKQVYEQKVICSIKRVQNLSQNAGNGHFRDSHFQNFLGEHAPRLPRKLAPSALVVPPPPLKVLDPLEISHTLLAAILQPWHLWENPLSPTHNSSYDWSLSSHTIPWIPG